MVISTPFPPEEGIGFHVYNLSKKLIEEGHDVSVMTRGHIKVENYQFEDIKVIKAPFLPIYPLHVHLHGWFIHRKLKRFIEKNFDLIHLHNPLVPVIKTNLPTVVTMHGSLIENVGAMELVDFKSFFSKILGRTFSYSISKDLINYADDVITISESVAQQIKEYYNFEVLKIIYNGVDTEKFHPSKNNQNYILYVGRLGHGKGIFDLLDAFKMLSNETETKLLIAGKGELEEKIRSKIRNEHINNVIMLGHVEQKDLVGLYQNAKIFVFPSHYEGLPTAVLEAMASGIPIVASDVSGCRDLINNNYNGVLVPPEDPIKLYESAHYLLSNPKFAEYLGKNARLTAEREYSWDVLSKKVEKKYKTLLDI